MKSVHIALNPNIMTSGTIDPVTDTALKFAGAKFVVIAPEKDVWSGPVTFNLPPLTNMAVTICYGTTFWDITGHPSARSASYLLPGNAVTSTNLAGAIRTEHLYNIEYVEVKADNNSSALVTFGDSITNGRGSTAVGNSRWVDDLAVRLRGDALTAGVGGVNTGFGGDGFFGGLGPAICSTTESCPQLIYEKSL